MFTDATSNEINQVMEAAQQAFNHYRQIPLLKRAQLMRAVADGLENAGDTLIQTAMTETHLPEARLRAERGRTVMQLRQYADACVDGSWMQISIDTAVPDKTPPKPDIRKMMVPLGPVVVFGASNFPFAYSTAGGDTASALAAGCTVVVKAHPAHAATSEMVASIIAEAVRHLELPTGIFSHVHGRSFEVGQQLVMHPHTAAVGFTGSFAGGKQLFDWANQRGKPIPVFAEMGSVNPVYLLPGHLKESAAATAASYAASVTLGVGQFCTNPGLIIGIESDGLNQFLHHLGIQIQQTTPAAMLHQGIASAYKVHKANALLQEGVHVVAEAGVPAEAADLLGNAAIATVDAQTFLKNPLLHQEVFGPFSLVVRCKDAAEMQLVAAQMEGQLTSTIMATEEDLTAFTGLVQTVAQSCGRMVLNGVPTGVEVCLSMHHGGPFPASTDARFSSVGADALLRFARPLCYQNWPDNQLPAELQNENPLHLWRRVNGTWSLAAL